MTEATPDTVYICSHSGEYGRYYPEAVEAEGALGGQALEYTRARPMTVAEAAKVIIAEIYRPATNEERPDWRYLSRLDLPSLRALSQGGE